LHLHFNKMQGLCQLFDFCSGAGFCGVEERVTPKLAGKRREFDKIQTDFCQLTDRLECYRVSFDVSALKLDQRKPQILGLTR